jgi:hypothetical protein
MRSISSMAAGRILLSEAEIAKLIGVGDHA